MDLTFERAARIVVGAPTVPVIVQPGKAPPRYVGEAGGHFTRGGTRISHPSAYGKRGWSNMIYVTSTERVEVGAEWRPPLRLVVVDGVDTVIERGFVDFDGLRVARGWLGPGHHRNSHQPIWAIRDPKPICEEALWVGRWRVDDFGHPFILGFDAAAPVERRHPDAGLRLHAGAHPLAERSRVDVLRHPGSERPGGVPGRERSEGPPQDHSHLSARARCVVIGALVGAVVGGWLFGLLTAQVACVFRGRMP